MKMQHSSKSGMIGVGWIALITIVIIGVWLAFTVMSFHNTEVMQRNLILAKQKDNTSEFDNLKKKINSVVSIPSAQFDKLKELFTAHASARTSQGSNDGSMMKWVQESIPNVDRASDIYSQVMNIVVSSRDSWTMRQKELLDLKRVHDNVLDVGFRGLILSRVMGRQKIEVTIITSAVTKEIFRTGEDNEDGTLFKKQAESAK